MIRLIFVTAAAFIVTFSGFGFAYTYDESDPTQGAGPQAPWRISAQWDQVDEEATRQIHKHTTDARYLTPMVSYIPDHPAVPSPRDFLGYIAGCEGKLTHPDDTFRYFRALAQSSSRVRVESLGKTEEDRDMILSIISSEENLARLDEWKGYTRALADPRNVNEEQALEMAAKAKPIFLVTGGLHSTETGPPEMVMELAYRIAVSDHPDIREIRDQVILLIMPVLDVDGRARVVEWNNRYLHDYNDRRYMPSASPPYWGKYTYHDNNRDGIQVSQALTQHYLAAFNEWHFVYSLDLHESVPLLYVSGGTGPYNPTLDPLVIREWQLAASWELTELQKHNLPGVWTWGFYTGWNPSYLLWITNNRNSMGRFYETFGNSSPATMERDLTERKFAGKDVSSRQWYRVDPPKEKVVWSLRNNTNYMQSGVLASLTFTARHGSMLLHNFWKKGRNSIERGKNEAPYAWVIPQKQRAPSRLAHLVRQLYRNGIEVHRATTDFSVEDGQFSRGDFIVRLDQPYGDFARNLLQDTRFPEDAEHRPYDDVSWTFGLIYGVDTRPILDKRILDVNGAVLIEGPVSFPGSVGETGAVAYAVENTGDNTLITARYMLSGHVVYASEEAFEAGGKTFSAGSWIIPSQDGLDYTDLQAVASKCMLDIHPLSSHPEVPKHELDLPRVTLYHNWISTQNDGWVRYTLEQAGVPYKYINDDHIKSGNLRSRYDVILIAHQGNTPVPSMIHGRDPRFGPMPYTRTAEFSSHGVLDSSPDITGGFGFRGLAHLEEFLNQGGMLLLMGSAGRLATETGLLRNVSSAGGVETPGSTLRTLVVRRNHPVVYGYEEISHVFRTNGPIYTVPRQYDHWIVMKYGTQALREEENKEASSEETGEGGGASKRTSSLDKKGLLLSGFVKGEDVLEKTGAILDVPRHAGGRVLLYSFNPLHRHLNHHDHNYVYNAILNWNDFPDPEPKDLPELSTD